MGRLTRTQQQLLTKIRQDLLDRQNARNARSRESRFNQPVTDDLAIDIMAAILVQSD